MCVCAHSVPQSCLTLYDLLHCSSLGSSVHGISQARILSGLPFPSPGVLPDPGIKPGSTALQADTLPSKPPGKRPHGLYSPWNSPCQATGVGSLCFLQGIFPTQESNWGLPHCRRILYQLSHKGSPRILEWVAYPFSSGSSQPRNRTGIALQADSLPTELSGTSHEMLGWMFHKLESRLPREISTTSDMQMIPLQWHKLKRN